MQRGVDALHVQMVLCLDIVEHLGRCAAYARDSIDELRCVDHGCARLDASASLFMHDYGRSREPSWARCSACKLTTYSYYNRCTSRYPVHTAYASSKIQCAMVRWRILQ